MSPTGLIRIARHLASGGVGSGIGRPRQDELCRAVSCAYYAMFHTLAGCCADVVVGATRARRSQEAWRRTYRALEHGHAKNQCANTRMLDRFPPEIQRFGELFVDMQRLRHYADYDPEANFYRSAVVRFIDNTEGVISRFENVDARDRRAFAVFVLLRNRR